jgi:hypothetical protein
MVSLMVCLISNLIQLPSLQAASDARPLEQAFSCSVLDNFNRANGTVGSAWSGQTGNYAIASNQLDVTNTTDAGPIIWNAGAFGVAQQACVKLAAIDTRSAAEVVLILKNETSSDVSGRMLTVSYFPGLSVVQVWTYDGDWVQRGADITGVSFAPGDVFGAQVSSSGMVEVYRDATLLGSRDASSWSYINQTGYIGLWVNHGPAFLLDDFGGGSISTATATPTPAGPTDTLTATPTGGVGTCPVLDTFNRSNGAIGSNWGGATSSFQIASNQLDVTNAGDAGPLLWSPTSFGADQQACVTFAAIDGNADDIALVLKAQGNSGLDNGLMEVLYDPTPGAIRIWTYDLTNDWVQRGSDLMASFAAGDTLGVIARANGMVDVYKSTTLLGSRDVSAWTYSSQGGYIGLWSLNGPSTFFGDFGGGAVTTSPTSTPTPTNTTGAPASGCPANSLVVNGCFESGNLNSWEVMAGSPAAQADVAFSGSWGLRMPDGAQLDQVISTVPGTTYNVSMRMRIDSQTGTPDWGGVRAQVVNSNYTQLGTSPNYTVADLPAGQWTTISFGFIADSISSRLVLQRFAGGTVAFVTSWDDVSVTTGAAGPTVTPVLPTPTSPPSSPQTPSCMDVQGSLCLSMALPTQSLPVNQPIPLTIWITGTSSATNYSLDLTTSAPAIATIEGQSRWDLSRAPGQSQQLTTNVRLLADGYVTIVALLNANGQIVTDVEVVRISGTSVVLNPVYEGPNVVVQGELEPGGQGPDGPAAIGGWQDIVSEGFEGPTLWPRGKWSVNSTANATWDDETYRPRTGSAAAWPAGAGTSGYSPSTSNNKYLNSMNAQMVYGPFDLRTAKAAEVSFWLWMETEATDKLYLEASTDNSTYTQLSEWNTSDMNWRQKTVSLSGYIGQQNVYVRWRFQTNASSTFQGPWIDDVLIRQYVPGSITVSGTLQFAARSQSLTPAANVQVRLLDMDVITTTTTIDDITPGGITVITDASGRFSFPATTNWDADDTASDPLDRRLDLAVRVFTSNDQYGRVVDRNEAVYSFDVQPVVSRNNVPDGAATLNGNISFNAQNVTALQIFHDVVRTRDFVLNRASTDPGPVLIFWETGIQSFVCPGPCYLPEPGLGGVFISAAFASSPDTVVHEIGHHYMGNIHRFGPYIAGNYILCLGHGFVTTSSAFCGYFEGWPTALAIAVNKNLISATTDDLCYDFGYFTCGAGSYNIESPGTLTPDNPLGDGSELRVAASIYDLFDVTNDGNDSISVGFDRIWQPMAATPAQWTFREYFTRFAAQTGIDRHAAVRAVSGNMIDYNDPPAVTWTGLPFRFLNVQGAQAQDFIPASVISASIRDDYSLFNQLTLTLQVTPADCRLQLDANRNIDMSVTSGWSGICNVSMRVSDSLEATQSQTFGIQVVAASQRAYIPVVQSGGSTQGPAGGIFDSGTTGNVIPPPDGYPGP